MSRRAYVHRISAAAPDDVSGIEAAIAAGRIDPKGIVAIFGKTEGNGCVNDFARGFATQSLGLMLQRYMSAEAAHAVCLVMSGGTEGGMSPHWTVFERRDTDETATGAALAIGRTRTPVLPFPALGRVAEVDMVAEGVRAAMADAGIADPADVHFVQIKCPLLTLQRIGQAEAMGGTVATRDTLKSMGLSRAASALGVAVALGEVSRDAITDDRIASDWSLWSGRASCSSGIELLDHEIVVIGTSPAWVGPLTVDHAVMADGIDVEPVRAALRRLGFSADGQLAPAERDRLVALLSKAEASHDGRLRGNRHTMLDDSDISATRHARAFVCGALAGLVGHAEIYVSGGAEHQGPDGGGPVAVIAARA
ncbi:ring-opening amidohydrolase [Rhodoplanes sp. TEM]|uniref:Cyanuric acid amidohydrolase n=1 Tax=Rhodoplanes tepidamans TaxID=200616 RepID=A0ABT5J381_RHOTP|nr:MULTISPECIES: ring-opening amidohydrolase [Rhodoplanes]MDC7784126.1 ring-opening amidohydrolase [Rhodoplanes tepidamans]MDC7983221.1 ring-opening amidohydrolase [Rhodoplanes sp. TEM]MDQ0356777.1 cyanuric acid amidohydrolase [Rhodoplanes tepidamans]